MNTEIIDIKNSQSKEEIYKKLKKYYEEDKLVAIPTETVYGLSANATSEQAVEKIYTAKGRPSDNPLIVHFYKVEQLESLVHYKEEKIVKLMENFWPGPMTLILNAKENNGIAKKVTAGLKTLAVRMPANKIAREILKNTEILLAAPSANTSGKPSPTKFEHVYHDMNGRVEVIIADKQADIGLESTVIDCTKNPFVIARPGSITREDIEKVLGKNSVKYNDELVGKDSTPIAPGMKYRHYSPEAELILYNKTLEQLITYLKRKDKKTGLLTYENTSSLVENLDVNIKFLAKNEKDVEQSAKNLYNILREFDSEGVEVIYMLPIEETKDNVALLNRLNKAISKK